MSSPMASAVPSPLKKYPSESSFLGTITGIIDKDVHLAYGPRHQITDLAWSSSDNLLALASWDNTLRVYAVTETYPDGEQKFSVPFGSAVLGCDWSRDGTKVVGAGADRSIRVLDVTDGGRAVYRADGHEDAISCVKFFDHPASHSTLAVTGSYDGMVHVWDIRQQGTVGGLECDGRITSLDVDERMLLIANDLQDIYSVDMDHPQKYYIGMKSPLKQNTTSVKCLPGKYGFVVGGKDGGCAIQYLPNTPKLRRNYTWECQPLQLKDLVFNRAEAQSINTIAFHPVFPTTLATGCANGTFQFWDHEEKKPLMSFPKVGGTIMASAFNHDGTLFAYSVTYDCTREHAHSTPEFPTKVMLHRTNENEVRSIGRKSNIN